MELKISEELLRKILEYLWLLHIYNEQQYIYWILLGPLIGLIVFIILWTTHKAHVTSLAEAIAFFFVPRGPFKMLIYRDTGNEIYVHYDYNIIKGKESYFVHLGNEQVITKIDPDAYAEPVSLLDARGPSGVPSPFGLWVRQLIAIYIVFAIEAISFANTFLVTLRVYVPLGKQFTMVDLIAFAALTLTVSWLIADLIRALSPQTMLTTLRAIAERDKTTLATPGLDVYSSIPVVDVLETLGKKIVVNVSDSMKKYFDEIKKETGDPLNTANLLVRTKRVEDFKRALGVEMHEKYDFSVAARARYNLATEKLPKGFLQRWAGVLALIAIILAAVLLIMWLQPVVVPVQQQQFFNFTGIKPAFPPAPPTSPMPPVSPAKPPAPPGG